MDIRPLRSGSPVLLCTGGPNYGYCVEVVTMGNFCSGQCDYKNIATSSAMKPVNQDSYVIFLQKYVCV